MKREIEAVTGKRVYEYTDGDGVVYYSFHRTANLVNPPKRLTLKSRIGEHLMNFVSRLRKEYDKTIPADKDEDDG
jgi:hypothetical protein